MFFLCFSDPSFSFSATFTVNKYTLNLTWRDLGRPPWLALVVAPPLLSSVTHNVHGLIDRGSVLITHPLDVRRLLGRPVDAGAADEQELPHAGRLGPVHHRPADGHRGGVSVCHVRVVNSAAEEQRV